MKKFLILAALMAAGSAFAQNTASGSNTQEQVSTSQATVESGAVVVGCLVNCPSPDGTRDTTTRQIIDGRQEVIQSGTTTVKNTPSVSGPPLVSSNDTCMGSTSGSVNVAGFGAGLGTTWTDQNCKMLKNSRELWNMGMKAAALALMCTDASNREALELTGFKCPTRKPEQQVVQSNGERYTDPIVRSRLGLPPLN